MSSKRVRIILLSGFALIAVVVCIGLALVYGSGSTASAPLPGTEAGASTGMEPTAGDGTSNNNGLNNVAVNTGNVQAVIATLSRPESYARHIRIESFFGDGSAVYDIDATIYGGGSAMKTTGPGGVKHIIIAGGRLYFWYEGEKEYYAGPADALGEEPALSDEFQMTLTYEDILRLDRSAIRDAGFAAFGGESCIYVKYVSGELNYTTTGYISVATGLLTGADQYDGHALAYRMTTSDFVSSVDDDSAFVLPDGKNAFSVP